MTIHTNASRPDGKNAPAIIQRALVLDPEPTVQASSVAKAAGAPAAEGEETADERTAAEAEEAQDDAEDAVDASDMP